jgi:hypothetical protein
MMSTRADVFRQRAEHLLRLGRCDKDLERQKICRTLAESYEALARNEEWLEGEFQPSEKAPSRPAA